MNKSEPLLGILLFLPIYALLCYKAKADSDVISHILVQRQGIDYFPSTDLCGSASSKSGRMKESILVQLLLHSCDLLAIL